MRVMLLSLRSACVDTYIDTAHNKARSNEAICLIRARRDRDFECDECAEFDRNVIMKTNKINGFGNNSQSLSHFTNNR